MKELIDSIVFDVKADPKGTATELLFKERYGSDWKKYAPIKTT